MSVFSNRDRAIRTCDQLISEVERYRRRVIAGDFDRALSGDCTIPGAPVWRSVRIGVKVEKARKGKARVVFVDADRDEIGRVELVEGEHPDLVILPAAPHVKVKEGGAA